MQHCPFPLGLFNHIPQSCRQGITPAGTCLHSKAMHSPVTQCPEHLGQSIRLSQASTSSRQAKQWVIDVCFLPFFFALTPKLLWQSSLLTWAIFLMSYDTHQVVLSLNTLFACYKESDSFLYLTSTLSFAHVLFFLIFSPLNFLYSFNFLHLFFLQLFFSVQSLHGYTILSLLISY